LTWSGLVALAAVLFVLGPSWHWQVLALALGEVALLGLMVPFWSRVPLVTWLFTSWMAAAILGAGVMSLPHRSSRRALPLWGARLGALVVAAVGARLGAEALLPWFGEHARPLMITALFWSLTGMLQSGLATRPWSVIAGVLATLAGTTAFFGLVNPSRLLLAGLLGLQLVIALVGGYLAQRVAEADA